MRSFASDNNAPVHPEVMQAIIDANKGAAVGYGADQWTRKALDDLRAIFGADCEPFLVLTGTAANVLSIMSVTRSYHAVLASDQAHLNIDETGAPELVAGVKVHSIPSEHAKIKVRDMAPHLNALGFEHASQPRLVSITQCTELGTVYTPDEIREIAAFAHENGMLLHMDGARLANAAVALNMGLRECTRDLGVDILSFGAGKNGLLCGEAVVFFTPSHAEDFKYMRKQAMQLMSKMRYLGAQMSALLANGLWRENAAQANRMAKLLADSLDGCGCDSICVTRPVQTNHVFASLPPEVISRLQKEFYFYVWNPQTHECRFVTSWNTTEEDVGDFVAALRRIMG